MAGSRILIVEDKDIIANFIRDSLESLEYDVSALVSSGDAALHEVEKGQTDLVLMDIRIKGNLDGIDTAEQICERFDLPVIYLTTPEDEQTLQRTKLTKPYGYIVKPFEAQDLQSAIEIALHRHAAESKRRKREQWLATALHPISEGVIVTDIHLSILYINPVAEAITGCQNHEVTDANWSEVFHIIDAPDRRAAEENLLKAVQKGVIANQGNTILLHKIGEKIPIDGSFAPIKDEKKNITGAVIVFRMREEAGLPIADSLSQQIGGDLPDGVYGGLPGHGSQLVLQVAELASMGFAASGIPHEVSQPLHAILIDSKSVLYWYKRNEGVLPDKFIKKITKISENADRIEKIIKNIRFLWGDSEDEHPDVIDFNETVKNGLSLMRLKAHKHGATLEIDLSAEMLPVKGNLSQLEQVVVNLTAVSLSSLDRGQGPHKRISISSGSEDGEAVLNVTDTGAVFDQSSFNGLSDRVISFEEMAHHDPRLALIKHCVETLDGTIEASRSPAGETTYTVRFPITTDKYERCDEILAG